MKNFLSDFVNLNINLKYIKFNENTHKKHLIYT